MNFRPHRLIGKRLVTNNELIQMHRFRYECYAINNAWIEENEFKMDKDEYDQWTDAHLAIFLEKDKEINGEIFMTHEIVASLRIIHRFNDEKNKKIFMIEKEYGEFLKKNNIELLDREDMAELSRLCLHKHYLSHLISGQNWDRGIMMRLYRLLYQYCKISNINFVYFASTETIIKNAKNQKIPIRRIAPLYPNLISVVK